MTSQFLQLLDQGPFTLQNVKDGRVEAWEGTCVLSDIVVPTLNNYREREAVGGLSWGTWSVWLLNAPIRTERWESFFQAAGQVLGEEKGSGILDPIVSYSEEPFSVIFSKYLLSAHECQVPCRVLVKQWSAKQIGPLPIRPHSGSRELGCCQLSKSPWAYSQLCILKHIKNQQAFPEPLVWGFQLWIQGKSLRPTVKSPGILDHLCCHSGHDFDTVIPCSPGPRSPHFWNVGTDICQQFSKYID